MKFLFILTLLSSAAFGSVDLTGKTASNGSIPANNGDCRKEFRIQGLSTSYGSQTNFISGSSDNCGFVIYADASGGLQIYLDQSVGQTGPCAGQPFIFPLASYTTGFATIRVQRTLAGNSGAGLPAFSVTAETWDGATGVYAPSTATGTTSGVCTFGAFAAGPANGSTLNTFVTAFAREYT